MGKNGNYDSNNQYNFYETNSPPYEQRAFALVEAKKHLKGEQLRRTQAWIFGNRRTISELRQLCKRWGVDLPGDRMNFKDEPETK